MALRGRPRPRFSATLVPLTPPAAVSISESESPGFLTFEGLASRLGGVTGALYLFFLLSGRDSCDGDFLRFGVLGAKKSSSERSTSTAGSFPR